MNWSAYFSMSWLYWTLMIIYAFSIISVIGVILSENRNPVKSLAWVTVLILFPAAGLILYIFFGRSFKNKHMISRRNKRRLKKLEPAIELSANISDFTPESQQQITLTKSLCGAALYPDNNVEIFTNGVDKFAALLTDLQKATKYILLQYYIFEDDNIGYQIRDILIDKAKLGIKVRVIYDHIGSISVKKRFFREMTAAGIQVYPFFRVAFPPFGSRINWRNHRKIVVIDGTIGYIGGMNIADRYISGGKFDTWRDTHIRLTGPAVIALQYSFAVDWSFMGQPLLDESASPLPAATLTPASIQMATSGPIDQWSNIAHLYSKAINNAKHIVYIQTPYFLPTENLLKALQGAALSNVDVRIMMPRYSDSIMLRYASNSYILECLNAGIKVYLYNPGMLHSKTLIIDNEFTCVGSANFDFRSFEHNFEGNIVIYSKEVNEQMRNIFANDQKQCTRIRKTEWRHRPKIEKLKESILRLLSPIL
jgi:cardiolipin synthase